jgi:hypothetical protein
MRINITLSVDEQAARRAREVAKQQGTSLNALIRDYIERLAGQGSGAERAQAIQRLWDEGAGHSGGYRFRRDDAYEDRLG